MQAPENETPTDTGATGTYTFGAVQFSTDGGDTWTDVPGTADANVVVGGATNA